MGPAALVEIIEKRLRQPFRAGDRSREQQPAGDDVAEGVCRDGPYSSMSALRRGLPLLPLLRFRLRFQLAAQNGIFRWLSLLSDLFLRCFRHMTDPFYKS